ncbi:hypothetical protein OROGR_005886 [Orobanche gracilis]
MLRKRTRSHRKDQDTNHLISDAISASYFHSDTWTQNQKPNSLKMPGLFVGFSPRSSSDTESVPSPTSPLDFRIFSSFGNPFRNPKSQNEAQHKSWILGKVGLSIIDSLDNKIKEPGNVFQSFDKKNILFERQMSIRSLDFGSHVTSSEAPKNAPVFVADSVGKGSPDVLFEIGNPPFEPSTRKENSLGARSMDSVNYGSYLTGFGNLKSGFGSGSLVLENTKNLMPLESGDIVESLKLGSISNDTSYIGPVPVSEIEHCEDYTCVRIHGPNPKVTHIFRDRVLDCRNDEVTVFLEKIKNDDKTIEAGGPSHVTVSYPSNSFLKFCYSCKKELDGEDIYMYRGEKAFCSSSCRLLEIELEEEMESTNNGSDDIFDNSSSGPEVTSKSGLFIAT